jgi:hypothetical protein
MQISSHDHHEQPCGGTQHLPLLQQQKQSFTSTPTRGGGGCDAFGIELAQSRRFSSSGLSLAFAYNRRLPQVTPVSWCFRLTTQKVVLQADEGSEVIPSRARVKRRSRKTRGEWNRRLRVTSIDVSFYALCNDYRM